MEYSGGMKCLLSILLLVFSVGAGAGQSEPLAAHGEGCVDGESKAVYASRGNGCDEGDRTLTPHEHCLYWIAQPGYSTDETMSYKQTLGKKYKCASNGDVYITQELPKKVSTPKSASKSEPPVLKLVGTGTGFFINGDGHIVTNSHVIKGCTSLTAVQDSDSLDTKIILDDPRNDLALLKVDKRPKVFATFRGGRGIRTAEDILALGYPFQSLLSDDLKITRGMVNSLAGLRNDTRMMQISAPVQPGNSGGPLLDHAGNVVGVVTSKMNAVKMAKHTGDVPQNINFALKASLVRDMLEVKSIDYETASSKKERKAVDIFDQARKYTVLIECNGRVASKKTVRQESPNRVNPSVSCNPRGICVKYRMSWGRKVFERCPSSYKLEHSTA